MKIIIVSVMILALAGCSSRKELMPDWSLKVSEGSRMKTVNNELYLTDSYGTFEIDLKTGNKIAAKEEIIITENNDIGKTGK